MNTIGPSSIFKVARIYENTAVAWEACGSDEVEHGQWLPGISFPFYLAHVVSLDEAKLTGVVILPLPA